MRILICCLLCFVCVSQAHAARKTAPVITQRKPTTKPLVENSVFFTTEFLFWKPLVAETAYSIAENQPTFVTSFQNDYAGVGNIAFARYDWRPGFRIGFGDKFYQGQWKAFAEYTYYYSKGNDRIDKPAAESLTSTFPEGPHVLGLSYSTSKIQLHYNTLDLEVSRCLTLGQLFSLNLSAGLKGASIHQRWTMVFQDANGPVDNLSILIKFIGGGFKTGLDAHIKFGEGFYFSGKLTGAALIGNQEDKVQQFTYSFSNNPMQDFAPNNNRLASTIQLLFGFGWERTWDTTKLQLFGGYEINSWFNILETYLYRFETPGRDEMTQLIYNNLNLHGLTFSVNMDF